MFHLNKLYLYSNFLESDGLKLISFFEDFDEVFINFNLNSIKKEKKYLTTLNTVKFKNLNKNKKENFILDYFNEKN